MNVESYDHCHPPQPTTSPLSLPELVAAYFEKKGEFPGSWPTLKSVNGLSEPLNALREEGGSTRNVHEKEPSPDLQVYRSSEHHGLPKPQQGELSALLSCTLHKKVNGNTFREEGSTLGKENDYPFMSVETTPMLNFIIYQQGKWMRGALPWAIVGTQSTKRWSSRELGIECSLQPMAK